MAEPATIDPILRRIGQGLGVIMVTGGIIWDVADGKFTQNLHDERLAALEKLTAVDQIVEYQVQKARVDWELMLLKQRIAELEARLKQ